MYLGAALTFPLGGFQIVTSSAPWVVNIVPIPETFSVLLSKPIRFTVRDSDTYIEPTQLRVAAGFASVFSNAGDLFEAKLSNTKIVPLLATGGPAAIITKTVDGISIQKATFSAERSVYATSIDAGTGYNSVAVTAFVRPDTVTGTASFKAGTVLGFENGARNKAIYVWFQKDLSNVKQLRITSFIQPDASSPTINTVVAFDWTGFERYTLLWNEVEGVFDIYGNVGDDNKRVYRVAITSIPDMPVGYAFGFGNVTSMTMLYGQVGAAGDASTWANVAITTDVGYPVLGNIHPGDFTTVVQGAEFVSTTGDIDPRQADLSAWYTTPTDVIANLDTQAGSSSSNGIYSMTKPTLGKTFSLFRQEPGFQTDNEGFTVEGSFSASNDQQDGSATGMGFTIFDGQTVFQFQLFNDFAAKNVGLLKKNGSNIDITEHYFPATPFDWTDGRPFRFVYDAHRAKIRLYDATNIVTPIMEVAFSRANLPSAADFNWTGLIPFIAIGHTLPIQASGTFHFNSLSFSHFFQSWDIVDANVPTAASPAYTLTSSGTVSSGLNGDGDWFLNASAGALAKFHRTGTFSDERGAIVEARLKFVSWRPFTRTGTYLILDDGTRVFGVTFVESATGKYVALSQRSDTGGFQELVGRDGEAATVSFPLDWTEYHTYRIERRPYSGLKIWVDDEEDPRLSYPESLLDQLPDPQFGGTATVALGQFSAEGADSLWQYVRTYFSRGFEISFKKNVSLQDLRKYANTQIIIVAHVQDADP